MRLVEDFEDTPSNSVENIVDVIEAVFSVEKMPSLLIMMMGKELDIRGGVAAMQVSVEEYIARRKETFPELKNETPNVEDFENFLFSPNRNGHITQGAMVTADFPVLVSANLTTLKVKIYMGHGWEHLDGGHPPDLFVNLKIHGLSTGIGMSKVKNTKVQKKNWTPCWAEEFEFPLCIPPQDASLLVEVYDHNIFRPHDFAGMNTLLVSQLRPGIRAVPLFDKRGNQCALLLISFSFV